MVDRYKNFSGATRLMTRMYDAALSAAGVSAGQFELLANIRGRQPVGQRALARKISQKGSL